MRKEKRELFYACFFRRSGVGLAVVNGQLFAVGGFDGTTYLKTIEASTYLMTFFVNKDNTFFYRPFLLYTGVRLGSQQLEAVRLDEFPSVGWRGRSCAYAAIRLQTLVASQPSRLCYFPAKSYSRLFRFLSLDSKNRIFFIVKRIVCLFNHNNSSIYASYRKKIMY
jgi:hypothetical protein